MNDRTKIRNVSDGKRAGVGPQLSSLTKQMIAATKIRSVRDGKRAGVGPRAD